MNGTNLEGAATNDSTRLPSKGPLSIHQKGLFVFWVSAMSLALFRRILSFVRIPVFFSKTIDVVKDARLDVVENGRIPQQDPLHDQSKETTTERKPSTQEAPTFDHFLQSVIIFGLIMFLYYVCDYEHSFPVAERVYSRDLFLFLVLLLVVVAAGFTRRETADKILNREQTEEWKGWMQVMFVWYHYFKAAETYNAVRVYIAAYVWMTGFGNFSFFWIKKDFSMYRVLKMLFRLNFLVLVTCTVTRNEYMLYYICPMHTFWFLSVYCFMRLLNSWNEDPKKIAVKFLAYFVLVFVLFDVPGVGEVVFKPLGFILNYENSLHEWMFRAGLDHYATLLGMLCAYHHPNFERLMGYLDEKTSITRTITRFSIALVCLSLFIAWLHSIFRLDKYAYNKLHPFFSFIPILTFIFLRNMFPIFRKYYFYLFTWLGKITLETYISQLHVYLQGNAKFLIAFFPGYPLLNFSFASLVYLFLSYHLFHVTVELSSFIIPKNYSSLLRKVLVGGVWLGACYLAGIGLTGLYFTKNSAINRRVTGGAGGGLF